MTPRGRKRKSQTPLNTEWEERGDSSVLGALFLVGLVQQVDEYSLQDLSHAISDTAAFEAMAGAMQEYAHMDALLFASQSRATTFIGVQVGPISAFSLL